MPPSAGAQESAAPPATVHDAATPRLADNQHFTVDPDQELETPPIIVGYAPTRGGGHQATVEWGF